MITGVSVTVVILITIFGPCKTARDNSFQELRSTALTANNSRSFATSKNSLNVTDAKRGFIVVAGGVNIYDELSSSVYFLDIATQKWESLADFPMPDEGNPLFFANDKIFRVAGYSNDAAFMVYNATYYMWQILPDLPQLVGAGACVAALDGNFHVIGGQEQMSKTQVVDIQAGFTWTVGATLQQARYMCGAATLGGYIYACGHRSVGNDGKTCEKYDPASDSWSFITSMLDYHEGQILVALGDYLYAVGGNIMGSAEKYDPKTDIWTPIKSMSNPARTFSAAVTDETLIYVVGGCAGSDNCDLDESTSVEAYIPELDQWVAAPSLPIALEDASALFVPLF